jgi:hypothetical protein
MPHITEHYSFSGEHYLTIDGVKYAARLYLPHIHRDLYDRTHVQNFLIPSIGTIRHHDYPEIQRFPSPEIVQTLQDLFGVALVPARLGQRYEVEYKGDRPIVIDNSLETIFAPSMIINFGQFQAARSNNLATLSTSVSET